MAADSFAALLTADGIHVAGAPAAQTAPRPERRRDRQRDLAAAVGHRGADARGEQQRHRREPGPPGRARHRRAGLVQRRGPGGDHGAQAARRHHRHPPGGRQRPVARGRDRARHAGQGPRAGRRPPRVPDAAGRPAGGRLFRHAVGRRERVRRDQRRGPGLGPGQDRQPGHRDVAGRAGLRQERRGAGLRPHGRPGPVRRAAGRSRRTPSTRPPPRWPAAAASS